MKIQAGRRRTRRGVGVITDRDICLALGRRDVPAWALVARTVMAQPVIGCAAVLDVLAGIAPRARPSTRRSA